MSATRDSPRQSAILVGVDVYLQGHARRDNKGRIFNLDNLRGCVNDVEDMTRLLRNRFGQDIIMNCLTSPGRSGLPGSADPTFANIADAFGRLNRDIKPGDTFFFHFSGHGARLKPTKSSPNRHHDPSLLTADFFQGAPAVRGWQLNKWLKTLHQKDVHVIVFLDSCHAGGSWRGKGDRFCSPVGWTSTLNLKTDETAALRDINAGEDTVYRTASSTSLCSIHPDRFIVMAACAGDHMAGENTINGRTTGVFTQAFVRYFEEKEDSLVGTEDPSEKSRDALLTYRVLCDRLIPAMEPQVPQMHGRVRLLFLGTSEPFTLTPVAARIDEVENKLRIHLGKIHALHTETEFWVAKADGTTFICTVTSVYDYTCEALLTLADAEDLRSEAAKSRHIEAYVARWFFGPPGELRVAVDPGLGPDFCGLLRTALQTRVAGSLHVSEAVPFAGGSAIEGLETFFSVTLRDDSVHITAGLDDPVHGLSLRPSDPDLARKTATVLAHIGRYQQILGVASSATVSDGDNNRPFSCRVVPLAEYGPHRYNCFFHNTSLATLFVTILNLATGYQVGGLNPASAADTGVPVRAGEYKSICQFGLEVPPQLQGTAATHSDIIRFIITDRQEVSLKSLELPAVWDSDATFNTVRRGTSGHSLKGTRLGVPLSLPQWWIEDVRLEY